MDDFQPLPPRALTMIRLRTATAVFVALLLLVLGIVALVVGEPAAGVACLAVAAGVVGVWWWYAGLLYRSYRWLLTAETIELRRGVIVRRHVVLPRTRVQNVTRTAGPVARAFGLVSVTVHSAGANTPNIMLPDVTVEIGESLRAGLLPAVAR